MITITCMTLLNPYMFTRCRNDRDWIHALGLLAVELFIRLLPYKESYISSPRELKSSIVGFWKNDGCNRSKKPTMLWDETSRISPAQTFL